MSLLPAGALLAWGTSRGRRVMAVDALRVTGLELEWLQVSLDEDRVVMKFRSISLICSISAFLAFAAVGFAEKKAAPSSSDRETVAKPLTEKEQKKREAKLRK